MSKDPREDNIQVRHRTWLLITVGALVDGALVGVLAIVITGVIPGFRSTTPLFVTSASPLSIEAGTLYS